MAKNTKVGSGAKSRNVQSGNMRNKAGSAYVHEKANVPKKVKKIHDVTHSEPLTPAQAQLIQEITIKPTPGAFNKRPRLVDPASNESLHSRLLSEIATRSKVALIAADFEHTQLK